MTVPNGAPFIPLNTAAPSRPGMRPAGSPRNPQPARGNQFSQALARAQSQNQAFRNQLAAQNGAGLTGSGVSAARPAGLPPDLEALAGLPGLSGAPGANGLPGAQNGPVLGLQAMAALQALSRSQTAATPPAAAQTAAPTQANAVPPPATPTLDLPGGFGKLVDEAARKYGVEPALIAAVIETESRFNPDAVSRAGAKGLMQLMPDTARGLGVTDPGDPVQNVLGGAKLLGQLIEKYGGNLEKAIAAYNAGSGAVDKYGGIPPYAETRKYVPLVLSALDKFRAQAPRAAAAPTPPTTPNILTGRR
jgi:soluble lytic murein transglycosylase-like protein